MAVYSAAQRSVERKPKPSEGTHTMTIKIERQNTQMESQHSFLLENEKYECWFNVFVNKLNDLAKACGIVVDAKSDLNTEDFKGRKIQIVWGKQRNVKTGKEYEGVMEFHPASAAMAMEAQAPQNQKDLSDLPF
jgi:hypothetical protein